jgi:uncharacterized protein (TIGR02996 family)
MSEEEALICAILAEPRDAAPRLVYADWLEERGDKDSVCRARCLRAECERDRLPYGDPRWRQLHARLVLLRRRAGEAWWRQLHWHELSLTLELLEQHPTGLRFRLSVHNRSLVELLLPYPEIHGLRFGNKATRQEAGWGTNSLVSASWAGFTLRPSEVRALEYHVRPRAVGEPVEGFALGDDYRWSVDLPAGEYLVWFQLAVGEDYFCPDSHYRFWDLLREADVKQAVVWTGQARSNRLHLTRA